MTPAHPPMVFPQPQLLCSRLLELEAAFVEVAEAANAYVERCHHDNNQRGEADSLDGHESLIGPDGVAKYLLAKADAIVEDWDVDIMANVARFILLQYAPQGLLGGCLLQNFSNPSNCHETTPALVHSMHSWQVGDGKIENNHSILFRQLLESLDIHLPSICSSRFSRSTEFLACSWKLPAYRLGLSLFPQARTPEILGAALFEIAVAVPSLVLRIAPSAVRLGASRRYFETRAAVTRGLLLEKAQMAIREELSKSANRLVPDDGGNRTPTICARIAEGFATSLRLSEEWSREVYDRIGSGYLDPSREMVRLVSRKAQYAVGYHGGIKLGERAFDELITADPEGFVRELGRSRWVSPGRPEESSFLAKLIAFGGPMFRVFSESEIAVIRNWITSLARPATSPGLRRDASDEDAFAAVGADVTPAGRPTAPVVRPPRPVSVRDLYFRLLNIEQYPAARSQGLGFASTWLARSAAGMFRGDDAIPFREYSHRRLRSWFEERARAQARSYGRRQVVDKSRDEVIDEAVQLCPMILIDGAWLQRWGNAGLVDTKVGSLLYKIFSDEIGNGDVRLNHSNIYRALMEQMGVELPDFRTLEFAHSRRFREEAFSVPVFWLSVSLFPRRFLPETLGLNLAMELSGVGGAYRTAGDELRHHGFSTLFVDLHNTIDNVSTGHSAMALEAVETYLDDVGRASDGGTVAAHWRRVWTGFRALSPPARSWKEIFVRPCYAF